MKYAAVCVALMLLSACLWAQTPAPAQPAPPPPAQAAPPMHHGMYHHMGAMGPEHMQEMKAQVAKMRATLEQMKAAVAKEKSTKEPQLERQNIELWEAMVTHLESMVSMMSPPEGMAPGMVHGGMMGHDGMGGCCAAMMKEGGGCCGGMKDGGGCCGGNKCTPPSPPEKPAPPAM